MLRLLNLILYAFTALHIIQCSTYCDFKKIFQTPVDSSRFDNYEILERSNFGDTNKEPNSECDSNLPKAFANAQVLVHVQNDKSKCKETCCKPPPCHSPYPYPHYPHSYPFPSYNPYIPPYPFYPYNYNPFVNVPYPNWMIPPPLESKLILDKPLVVLDEHPQTAVQIDDVFEIPCDAVIKTYECDGKTKDEEAEKDCYDEEKIIEDILSYEGSGCKPLHTTECLKPCGICSQESDKIKQIVQCPHCRKSCHGPYCSNCQKDLKEPCVLEIPTHRNYCPYCKRDGVTDHYCSHCRRIIKDPYEDCEKAEEPIIVEHDCPHHKIVINDFPIKLPIHSCLPKECDNDEIARKIIYCPHCKKACDKPYCPNCQKVLKEPCVLEVSSHCPYCKMDGVTDHYCSHCHRIIKDPCKDYEKPEESVIVEHDCPHHKIVINDFPRKLPIHSCLPKECDKDEIAPEIIYCPHCKKTCDQPYCPNCQKVLKEPCVLEVSSHCPYCKRDGVTDHYCSHCRRIIKDPYEDYEKPEVSVIVEHDCPHHKIVINDFPRKLPIHSCLPKECDNDEIAHEIIYCPHCKKACDKPYCPNCQKVLKEPCVLEVSSHCPYCKRDGVTDHYCSHCRRIIKDPYEDYEKPEEPIIVEHDCPHHKIVIDDFPIKVPSHSCLPKECDKDEIPPEIIYCPHCKKACDEPYCPNCQKVLKEPCVLEVSSHCPYCKRDGVTDHYCSHCRRIIKDPYEDCEKAEEPIIVEHDCPHHKIVINDFPIKLPIHSCLPKECDKDEILPEIIYCPHCKKACDKPYCPNCQKVLKEPCVLEVSSHCPYCKRDGVTDHYCSHCRRIIKDPCEDYEKPEEPIIVEDDCPHHKIVINDFPIKLPIHSCLPKECDKDEILPEIIYCPHCKKTCDKPYCPNCQKVLKEPCVLEVSSHCPYCKRDGVTDHYCSHCRRIIKDPYEDCEKAEEPIIVEHDCPRHKIVINDFPIKLPIHSCLPKECDKDEILPKILYCPHCKKTCDKPYCPNCQKVLKEPCVLEVSSHCPYCKRDGVTDHYCSHCRRIIKDPYEDCEKAEEPIIVEHDCPHHKIVINDFPIKLPIHSCLPKECDKDEILPEIIYCPHCKKTCDKPYCPNCQKVLKEPCVLEVSSHCPYCKRDGVTDHYCSYCQRVIKDPCKDDDKPKVCDKYDDDKQLYPEKPCSIKVHSFCTVLVDPTVGPPTPDCVLIDAGLIDLDNLPTRELSDVLERENLRKCQEGTKKCYRCQKCSRDRPLPHIKHEKPPIKTEVEDHEECDDPCDAEDDDDLPGVLVEEEVDDDDDGKSHHIFIYDPNKNTGGGDDVKEVTPDELEKATFLAEAAADDDFKEIIVCNDNMAREKKKEKKNEGKYYFLDGSKLGGNPYECSGCSCCSCHGANKKPFKYDIDDLNVQTEQKCNKMEVLLPKSTPAIDPICVAEDDRVVEFVYDYPHPTAQVQVPRYPVFPAGPSLTDRIFCLHCGRSPCQCESRRIAYPTKRCSCQHPCSCRENIQPIHRPCTREQYSIPGRSARRPCSSCAPYAGELVTLSSY